MGEHLEILAQSLQEHYMAIERVRQAVSLARAGGGKGALIEALELLRLARGGLESGLYVAKRISNADSQTLIAFYLEVSSHAEMEALEEAREHVDVEKDIEEVKRLRELLSEKSL